MTAPQITSPGSPPDPLAPQPTFRATFYAYLQGLVLAFGDANTAFDWMNTTADSVDADATATETARQQVVDLEATAQTAATQAALSAVASATTGVSLTGFDFGAKLTIIDNGNGGKLLGLDSGADRIKHITLTGTTPALDLSAAGSFYILLTGATTFSIDATGLGDLTGLTETVTLYVEQGGTEHGWSWPGDARFANDLTPTPPGANQVAQIVITVVDGITGPFVSVAHVGAA